MKISMFIVLMASSALVYHSESALADSALIYNTSNTHWYQRFDASMSWYAAKVFCEKRAGYLATITSQQENDFVWAYLASKSSNAGGIWLGATNDKTSSESSTGAYQWITGEKWSYSNWNIATGEPNNAAAVSGGGEHYLELFPAFMSAYENVIPGSWNDISVYNQGTLWGEGQDNYPTRYRPISSICEWGGNLTSTNF